MRATPISAAVAVILASIASPASAAPAAPAGASSCTGCHAANPGVDSPIPRLNGRGAAETAAQMREFKTGQRKGTVMERLAKGYSDAEIQAIAEWYAQQK
jgi:cytochrome subunit of sulfide dehydrogenase